MELSKTNGESYKHAMAKEVLRTWLYRKPGLIGLDKILRVTLEDSYWRMGVVYFIADIGVYTEDGLVKLIEVKNKHAVDNLKLFNMKYYFRVQGFYPELIEISANAILENTGLPDKLFYKTLNYLR